MISISAIRPCNQMNFIKEKCSMFVSVLKANAFNIKECYCDCLCSICKALKVNLRFTQNPQVGINLAWPTGPYHFEGFDILASG